MPPAAPAHPVAHPRATTRYNYSPTNNPHVEAPDHATQIVPKARWAWASLRIALAWVFLWAFLDKTFGLGFATPRANAWLNGGSPTHGFLSFGTQGPLASLFQSLAGNLFVDWLFMVGLLGIGLALLLGIGMRVAAAAGSLMMVLMWLAALPPGNNPFMDDHLVYAIALWALVLVRAGDTWGLGAKWRRLPVVQRAPLLE